MSWFPLESSKTIRTALTALAMAAAIAWSPAPAQAAVTRYVLSEPVEQTAELGPWARGIHYARTFLMAMDKPAMYYMAHHNLPMAGLIYAGMLVYEFPTKGFVGTRLHLNFKLGYNFRKGLLDLAELPGATKIHVLTSKKFENEKLQAVRASAKGLVILETEEPLPPETLAEWDGKLLPLENFPDAKLVLRHKFWGQESRNVWEIPAADLDGKIEMPANVQEEWTRNTQHVSEYGYPTSIDAELRLDDGTTIPIGPMFEDGKVRALLKIDGPRTVGRKIVAYARKIFGEKLSDFLQIRHRQPKIKVGGYSTSWIEREEAAREWMSTDPGNFKDRMAYGDFADCGMLFSAAP